MFGFGGDKDKEGQEAAARDPAGGDPAGGAPEGVAAEESSAGAKVETMKSGDYVIHVHVQWAKNIYLEGEDTADPLVKVQCMNQTKLTGYKQDVSQAAKVIFDEHLFFEFKKLENEVVQDAFIGFRVENKGFFKSDLIGLFEMSVLKIYGMKNHTMEHQLVGIANPEAKDFSKITGQIALSVNVQGPGDEARELKMGSDEEVKAKGPLMPSSIKNVYKQIYLRLYRAEGLPVMDTNLLRSSSIDAYAQVRLGKSKITTKVITQEDNCVEWLQEMLIPVTLPIKDDKLILQIYDSDSGGLISELACSVQFSLKSICKWDLNNDKEDCRSLCKWVNLFGAPKGYSGSQVGKMNEDPSIATAYCGRILVEYFTEEIKTPMFKVRDIDPNDYARVQSQQKKSYYCVFAELGSGICLPRSGASYKLKLKIGEQEWNTNSPVQTGENYCRWDTRIEHAFEDTYDDLKRFPPVFVYLMDGEYPVCFYKDSALDFMDPAAPTRWLPFEPDLAVGSVTKEYKAGFFQLRLYIHNASKNGQFDPAQIPRWKEKLPKRLKAWKLRVNIYQCESLPPADSTGTSDPYIEVWTPNKQQIRTSTCNDTNNPLYYQVKEIPYEFNTIERAPPLVLNIFDTDDEILDSTDDYIGRAVIFLHEVKGQSESGRGPEELKGWSEDDRIPYPVWFPVKRNYDDIFNEETGAAVLVSLQLVEFDYLFKVPADQIELDQPMQTPQGIPLQMPDLSFAEFKCDIIVLGLRNLVSTGLLPVRKPFVKFNLKSLLPPSLANAVDNIVTQPKDGGPNPNIKSTLQLEIKIPSDPTFCPRMTCDVFDQLFFEGMPQPHIGTFTLKLGDLIIEMQEADNERMQELNEIVNILQQIVKRQRAGGVRVTDLVSTIDQQRKEEVDEKKQEALRWGEQILEHVAASGLELPSSSAKNCKTKGGRAHGDHGAPKSKREGGDSSRGNHKDDAQKIQEVLGTNVRKKVQLAFEADIAQKKAELEEMRAAEQKALAATGSKSAFGNVIMPVYRWDERLTIERECGPPAASLFKEIGHDPEPGAGAKHYRRYYPDELENVKDERGEPLIASPFLTEKITRAQTKKAGGMLAGLFGGGEGSAADMSVLEVGDFKGIVRCYNEALQQERKEEVAVALAEIKKLVAQIYEVECSPKTFDFDLAALDLSQLEGFEELDSTLKELRKYIDEAGLGKLNIHKQISNFLFEQQLASMLNESTKCKVRLYIIEGFNFAQRDPFSLSDPYLIIKCGKSEFNEQKNYQLDTSDPKFHKCYDFIVDFPGAPPLEISAYDYDDFFGDDLIGKTVLDLDDRYFSQGWQAIEEKPIEYRDLFHTSSTVTQGVVKMWCEINQKDSKTATLDAMDISPAPVQEYEARLVIWKTRDIESMDLEGASDVYVRAFFDPDDDKLTDTHWRCFNGAGSFNYRLLLNLKSQRQSYLLTIQAWDKDIVARDDLVGECQLDIGPLFEDVEVTNTTKHLSNRYFADYMKHELLRAGNELANDIEFEGKEKFWVPVRRYVQEKDLYVAAGEVQCSLSISPQKMAKKYPQGSGRQEPNSDPFLPEPEGRIKLSLNPIEMLQQMVPPALQRKLLLGLLAGLTCFLCVMMAPMIISNIIAKSLVG